LKYNLKDVFEMDKLYEEKLLAAVDRLDDASLFLRRSHLGAPGSELNLKRAMINAECAVKGMVGMLKKFRTLLAQTA
jgi:hypothetical protein